MHFSVLRTSTDICSIILRKKSNVVYSPKPSSELELLTASSTALAAWLLSDFADLPREASASGAWPSWVSEAPPGMSGMSYTLKLALSSLHRILRFKDVLLVFLRGKGWSMENPIVFNLALCSYGKFGGLSIFKFNCPRTSWPKNGPKIPWIFADILYLGKI